MYNIIFLNFMMH